MTELDSLRTQINQVDKQVVSLLEERFKLVRAVGEYKRARHLAILDEKREAVVLQRVASLCQDKSLVTSLQVIYQTLMNQAKEQEENLWWNM